MYMHILKITLLSTVLILNACVHHPSIAPSERPTHWGQSVNSDQNLFKISEMLYRSEQPLAEQATQLKALGIDRIISLRSRNQTAEEFHDQDFLLIHQPIHTWTIDRDDVLAVMHQIQDARSQNQQVLVHCYHGSDRTGTMVAMYRILFEHWQIDDAVKEMKYGGYGFHPIWINIDNLFTQENIDWLKANLNPVNSAK